MVRNIGEIFEFSGKWYKVVKDTLDKCNCCAFYRRRDKTCDLFREVLSVIAPDLVGKIKLLLSSRR